MSSGLNITSFQPATNFTESNTTRHKIGQMSFNTTSTPDTMQTLSPFFYGIILEGAIVLVVLGNALVLLALLCFRHLTAADVFLFSLSLADLLDSAVALQLITVVKYFLRKPMTKHLCDAFVSLVYTFRMASSTTVTAMAVDRSLLLVWPIKHHTAITASRIKKLLLGVWISSTIGGILPLIGLGNSGFQGGVCYYQLFDLGREYAILVEIYGAVMLLIVLSSYFAIKLTGRQFIKRQSVMAPASAQEDKVEPRRMSLFGRKRASTQVNRSSGVQSVRRLTVMMAAVVVIYYVSWLPFLLSNLRSLIIGQRPSPKLSMFTSLISLLHALANPVLYGWMSQRYRNAYKFVFKMILCACGGHRPSRRCLSISRRSVVPRPESMNRMSMSQINVAFQPDGESQKPVDKDQSRRRKTEQEQIKNEELKERRVTKEEPEAVERDDDDESRMILEILDTIIVQIENTQLT